MEDLVEDSRAAAFGLTIPLIAWEFPTPIANCLSGIRPLHERAPQEWVAALLLDNPSEATGVRSRAHTADVSMEAVRPCREAAGVFVAQARKVRSAVIRERRALNLRSRFDPPLDIVRPRSDSVAAAPAASEAVAAALEGAEPAVSEAVEPAASEAEVVEPAASEVAAVGIASAAVAAVTASVAAATVAAGDESPAALSHVNPAGAFDLHAR